VILLCDAYLAEKLVNCAVLTGNSAGLRTLLSSLSERELRSSLRESHSFLSLPAGTTMASSQGTPVSSNSFSRWASHDIRRIPLQIPLLTQHFTLSFRMTLWQTANDSLVFIHHSHMHKKTHKTDKKSGRPDGKPVLCQRTFSSVLRAVFLHS
jgi:hypothetical protein